MRSRQLLVWLRGVVLVDNPTEIDVPTDLEAGFDAHKDFAADTPYARWAALRIAEVQDRNRDALVAKGYQREEVH